MTVLNQFSNDLRVAIVGASGGLGTAFVNILAGSPKVDHVFALSRNAVSFPSNKVTSLRLDITQDAEIEETASRIKSDGPLDLIITTTGLLHSDTISPEKSARDIEWKNFEQSFAVNTFGPALVAKHFLPLLHRDRKTVFAAFSARVGSISDNRLGGWYAYRASKAALNMLLKTFAIEYARRYKKLTILGLHPGTVDTSLSAPFQRNVPDGKLFTPEFSAQTLLEVINQSSPEQSGSLIAWDGTPIPF